MPDKRWILLLSLAGVAVVGALLWHTWQGIKRECQLPEPSTEKQFVRSDPEAVIVPSEETCDRINEKKSKGSSRSQQAGENSVAIPSPTPTPAPVSVQLPTSFLDSVSSQVPPEDRATVADIANQFSEEMTQVRAPQSSPEYRKAWHDATERADAKFIQQLGSDLYNRLQFTSTNNPVIAP